MVVSLYFGGKSHVSNGQNISFKEPCLKAYTFQAADRSGAGCGGPYPGKAGEGGLVATFAPFFVVFNGKPKGIPLFGVPHII